MKDIKVRGMEQKKMEVKDIKVKDMEVKDMEQKKMKVKDMEVEDIDGKQISRTNVARGWGKCEDPRKRLLVDLVVTPG